MFILLDNNLTLCLYFSDSVSPSVKLTYSVTCHFCPSETYSTCFSSVQSLSRVQFFVTPWTAARQATCPSSTPGVYSNSCPLSWWYHPTISSSVVPFSSCPQSFPASGSFQMSQFFTSGGQSIGVSALASVLPMDILDWFPLEWTGWISLQSKGLSRVFSNTTVQKQILQCSAFFIVQLSHPYMTTGKTIALTRWTFVGKLMSLLFNMLSMLVIVFLPRIKRLLAAVTTCSDFGAQKVSTCLVHLNRQESDLSRVFRLKAEDIRFRSPLTKNVSTVNP